MIDHENHETVIPGDNIRLCRIDGELIYLIDGLAFEDNQQKTATYGLLQSDLGKYAKRGQTYAIAQFYSLVGIGLICTRHIFLGLNRPLYDNDNPDADKVKFIHCRKPLWDCKWGGDNQIVNIPAPVGKVFVTIISKNVNHRERFPMVYGWVDWWNWVQEDEGLAEAPVNWVDRYDLKIYSRP